MKNEVLLKSGDYVSRTTNYEKSQSMKHAWRAKRVNFERGMNKKARSGKLSDIGKGVSLSDEIKSRKGTLIDTKESISDKLLKIFSEIEG